MKNKVTVGTINMQYKKYVVLFFTTVLFIVKDLRCLECV